jgi:opacity protein-like surface antigen
MRKTFTALFILTGFCSIANAQISKGFELGANIGYNTSTIQQFDYYDKSGEIGGVNLGFSAEYYFSENWSIKGKLTYDQKGWADGYIIEDTSPAGGGTSVVNGIQFNLNYLTVPVMASWHFGRARNWYLHFGPYVGFLLSASDNNNDGNVKPLFNSTDFGFDAGIGVKFPVAKKVKLFIEADGQSGIPNIVVQNGASSLESERSSLNFGVTFDMN